ncbi:membrane protein [Brevibacillus reuszeri]|uniref:DMT family transporter n=1 Tax=Brevibacillus reuszeri TaxID=54915 RepID=UPI001B20F69A|nr:DMT family transporter [Brevibacillus reuszeri]GIO09219.1 membrane protein [Brevibacillus reuszeri]
MPFILLLLAGMMMPVQSAANVQLRSAVASPYLALAIAYFIGFLLLTVLCITQKNTLSSLFHALKTKPSWAWLGGALGVIAVLANLEAVPVLGAALTFALILTGQMVMSIVIDHFGFFHMTKRKISATRLIGIASVLGGILLIRFF